MLYKLDLALGLHFLVFPSYFLPRKRVLNHALLALPLARLSCHNNLKKKKSVREKWQNKNHEDQELLAIHYLHFYHIFFSAILFFLNREKQQTKQYKKVFFFKISNIVLHLQAAPLWESWHILKSSPPLLWVAATSGEDAG